MTYALPMPSGFVGRGVELRLLEAACSRASREGRPAAMLVTGLPGSGKTRLLAELRGRHEAGYRLAVQGFQTGAPVPLAAAGDLLRQLAQAPGEGARLDAAIFGATSPDDRPLEPLRLFEAAHRAMVRLEGGILILIDDLQWVDELSIALCSYLIRSAEAEGKPVALIAASRPAGTGATFYESVTRELGPDRAETMVLGPLERDDGVRLVRQLAPSVSLERAAELWSVAQGSPFWLGLLARGGGQGDLAGYLLERARGLSRDAVRLLGLLAVLARPVSPIELDGTLRWDQGRTQQAVAELERAGLLVVDMTTARLAHDLIRSAAYRQLPLAQRVELHQLVGNWLEQQAGVDVQVLLEALGHQREAGGKPSHLALRVLESPRRRLLGREGLRAVAQLADAAGFDDATGVALRERVALLVSELGEHQLAMERWIELAEHGSDPRLQARCYLGASRAASRIVERRDEALPLLEKAKMQNASDPVIEVEILAHHANLLRVLTHQMEDARRIAEQAVAISRRRTSQDPNTITDRDWGAYALALQAAHDAAVIEEDTDSMQWTAEEMMRVARSSEEAAIMAALNLSMARWDRGNLAEAVDLARRAWVQSHERTMPMLILAAGSSLAGRLMELGALSEAEEVISECVELEQRVGGPKGRLAIGRVATRSVHELRHVIWFSRGDWTEAATSLEQEVALQPDPHYRSHLHGIRAMWLARCSPGTRRSEIERHLLAGRADVTAAGCPRCRREFSHRAGEALVRLGRIDEAEKELQVWQSGRGREPNSYFWTRQVAALVALAKGDVAAGIRELETVVAERKRVGLVAGLLWARLDLAAALVGSDPGRAVDEFRQAGLEAGAAGAKTEEGYAELGLRKLGVRTWRRGRATKGETVLNQLNERERQILTLVAAGNSNPEIASRLFLSRKTVERHVSNILARSGARNRTDLARLASELTSPMETARERARHKA